MWVFLVQRLRIWLFFAVAAPALSWLLGLLGDRMEARNGPTRMSRALQQGRGWLQRRSRGPLAHRHRGRPLR